MTLLNIIKLPFQNKLNSGGRPHRSRDDPSQDAASTTLWTWVSTLKLAGRDHKIIASNAPLSALSIVIPDLDISPWRSRDLNLVAQLLDQHQMHSFQDLTKTFGIAHKDFYKYLQIRNFLSPMKKGEDLLLKSIYTFFASEKLVKRGISFICTALCSRMILDKLPTMISWECDLGISYTTLQ